jgi:hypothetical protein
MTSRRNKAHRSATEAEQQDARGQFQRGKKGSTNSGLVSAEPRVLGDGEREASDWNEGEEDQRDISLPKREM